MRIVALVILIGSLVQFSSCIRYSNNIVLAGLQPAVASATYAFALATPAPTTLVSAPATLPAKAPRPRTYLALGDSYTIGQSVDIADRYPVQLVNKLNADGLNYSDPEIIATSGWTTTNLLNALRDKKADTPYDLVTLLIGVNNQYQRKTQAQYREEFTSLLVQAIALAGDNSSHVIVLSIPDYSVTPFARFMDKPLIISQIDSFNRTNKEISRNHHVRYIDITWESRKAADDPSLIAEDGLHFSGKEYEIWAAMMEKPARRN
ncbi:MAG TPA: SGNH/GDSL hydrolase family protein [Puia sp.]|nr:SGNH/GDSL hydrolase family protein [Puia sp.]